MKYKNYTKKSLNPTSLDKTKLDREKNSYTFTNPSFSID